MRKMILLFLLLLAFTGCQTINDGFLQDAPTSVPTLTPMPSITTTQARVPSATVTLLPTPTHTSTPTVTAEPTHTASPSPTPEPVTLIGAGDIVMCENDTDERTAAIIDQYPGTAVFTAGDNVYGDGTAAEFKNCYGPSWGRFRDRTRPSTGNHDYMTEGAIPYYGYFGDLAGEPGKGYYSYDLGNWHIVVLNSNCNDVGCKDGSQQMQWLRADLTANSKQCTLAYWHHPRFSSGKAGSLSFGYDFWLALYDFGAEVVVNGHDHNYERFAPQRPDGTTDPNGIRQFVVGTGGATQRQMAQILPNSEAHQTGSYGVIKFTLYPEHYDWEFLSADGSTYTDSGSDVCH